MSYLIYDKKSGKSKAKISARCFAEIDTQKNLRPKVVDGLVWHVNVGAAFAYGNEHTGLQIIVHTDDFIVKSQD